MQTDRSWLTYTTPEALMGDRTVTRSARLTQLERWACHLQSCLRAAGENMNGRPGQTALEAEQLRRVNDCIRTLRAPARQPALQRGSIGGSVGVVAGAVGA